MCRHSNNFTINKYTSTLAKYGITLKRGKIMGYFPLITLAHTKKEILSIHMKIAPPVYVHVLNGARIMFIKPNVISE